jgi:hypothetical protein
MSIACCAGAANVPVQLPERTIIAYDCAVIELVTGVGLLLDCLTSRPEARWTAVGAKAGS